MDSGTKNRTFVLGIPIFIPDHNFRAPKISLENFQRDFQKKKKKQPSIKKKQYPNFNFDTRDQVFFEVGGGWHVQG